MAKIFKALRGLKVVVISSLAGTTFTWAALLAARRFPLSAILLAALPCFALAAGCVRFARIFGRRKASLAGHSTVLSIGENSRESRVIAIASDVARSRQTDLDLRRANELFALAAQVVNAVIYEWEAATGVVSLTRGLRNLLGYDENEIPGTAAWWHDQVHPRDRERLEKQRRELAPGTSKLVIEYRLRHRDGRYVDVCDRANLEWADGKLVRVVGSTEDITERKARERRLRHAKVNAEDANEAKTAFIANMSHEIRTPLGAVLGFADLLADPGLPLESRLKYVDVIRRNGEVLSRIIDDILDLSKVEADRLDLEVRPTSLPDVITDVTSVMAVKAREKGIDLAVSNDDWLPAHIKTDATRLKQILVNIIGNAIKFTDLGSVNVKISAKSFEKRGTSTCLLKFDVQDTGIGLTPDQADRLFEPFVQGDQSTNRRYGGTGLGLVLSRRLANALGGNVELLRSKSGEGTIFRISIAAEILPEALTNTAPFCSAALPNKRRNLRLNGAYVLVADDAPDNRLLIEKLLTSAGAKVETVTNGREAMDAALERKFDLILMDMQMPVLDGLTATWELRKLGYSGAIVALTAHALKQERERCLESGCDAHLTKPVDRALLLATVAEHAGISSDIHQQTDSGVRPALSNKLRICRGPVDAALDS